MLGSVFLRRLVAALALVLLIAVAIILCGYAFLSNDVYTDIKLDELVQYVDAGEQLAEEYINGNIEKPVFDRLAAKLLNSCGTAMLYLDEKGEILYYGDNLLNCTGEDAKALLAQQIDLLKNGMELRENRLRAKETAVLAIGKPIMNGGETDGVIIMLSSVEIVTDATTRLTTMMCILIFVTIPAAFLGISWRAKNITEPVSKMSEAAKSMAQGDYHIQLDENVPGELGQLAATLNYLGGELQRSIYQLSSEKSQLNQLLQSLNDGVAATDERGELTHYNSAIMRMFGAVSVGKRQELIGDDKVWAAFDRVFATGVSETFTYPMPGDKVLWITVSPVVTESKTVVGVVGLFKDMTEAEQLEKLRNEYVANVSHELRTPLTAVRGLLEPLCDGLVKDEDDRQRYYKIMLHEVIRLSRLITDMMTLSRLQAGTEYMEISRVDVNELLQDIAGAYSAQLAKKGVELILDDPKPVPDAMTDPDRIEQVLVILLDNASRFTPKGGSITIGARNTKDKIVISVADTGCGIAQNELEHIFERFYKVDKSHTGEGTGLGLSIAKFIMEKLGETITVKSEVGKGTCFTLTLKRYVRNAIALGPAGEKLDRYGDVVDAKPVYEDEMHSQYHGVMDAPYEVIGAAPKAEKQKKLGAKADRKKNNPQNKDEITL